MNHWRADHEIARLNNGWILTDGGDEHSNITEYYSYYHVPDATLPTVSGLVPASGEADVMVDRNVSFRIADPYSSGGSATGINRDTLNVTIDATVVVANGVFQSGYSGLLVPDQLGGYFVTVNPDGYLANGQELTVNASDYGQVLIAGGHHFQTELSTCEIFDPVTETWSYTQSMDKERVNHTVTKLFNGQALVTGGRNSTELRISSCQLYDPATNTWSATDDMNATRTYHSATLLFDGRVLAVGGMGSDHDPNSGGDSTSEVYQPE